MVTNLRDKISSFTHIECRIVEMLSLSTDLPNPFIKEEQLRIQMEHLLWK